MAFRFTCVKVEVQTPAVALKRFSSLYHERQEDPALGHLGIIDGTVASLMVSTAGSPSSYHLVI
jgi:hypothetical protein